MVQKCPPICKHQHVNQTSVDERVQALHGVGANADCIHEALALEFTQGREPLARGAGASLFRVVGVEDVDTIDSQPLEARLERSAYAVEREVPDPLQVPWHHEPVVILGQRSSSRLKEATHLG